MPLHAYLVQTITGRRLAVVAAHDAEGARAVALENDIADESLDCTVEYMHPMPQDTTHPIARTGKACLIYRI